MSSLFDKVVLNNKVEVPSRLAIAPLTLFSSNPDGTLNDEEREYLKMRGKGIGLYILGATCVNQQGLTFVNQPRAFSEKDLPSLTERAKIIKDQGAKAIIQIHHGGNRANKELSGLDPVNIDTITDEKIKKLINDFGYATELSIKSGHDGIEIHGANGFVLQQFYSRHSNHRTDAWGGSDEKRMSFALKVVDACCKAREKLNRPDFIIGYRLSPEEPDEDGLTMTETLKLVRELVKKPLQFLHVSESNYFTKAHRGEGAGQERLKTIHNAIKGKLALVGVGGLKSEKDFNTALKSGFSEFIGAGKASMMNKDLGILLKEGKGNKLNLELDLDHPEKYSIPKNLWDMCHQGMDWLPPVKSKSHK